jgi:PAS domain S-box-containing protein
MTQSPTDLAVRHLAKIVDTSEAAIVSKDLDGTILSWNAAAERMFGFTAVEAIGKSIRLIIPQDRQSEEDSVLGRIRQGEAVSHYETIRQRKDGSRIHVSLTVSPVCDERGVVVAASTIGRDISDRRTVDLAAKRLAALVESSDDAIVAKDLEGTILAWNPAAERMFGYSAAEAIGRSIRLIIPADRQAEEDHVLAQIRAGEAVRHFETIRQRKDGTLIPISLSVSPIRDDDGTIVGASKIARDISEESRLRAAAEEQARTTSRLSEVGAVLASSLDREVIVEKVIRLSTELTSAQCGAFFHAAIDPQSGETRMRYTVSGMAEAVFADSLEPPLMDRFVSAFGADDIIRLEDVTGDQRYHGWVSFHATMAQRWAARSYMAVAVRTASGEVLGALCFGHSNAGVFSSVHEQLALGIAGWASLALVNAELYLEVRQADRLKDEFLAVLSHELRTPLNAILGYSRLLRGGILSGDKASRGLETLERNAMSLTQIVEDVLDVSRIVTGKIRLDVQPVELPLVVHNAVATVQPAADAKGIRLQMMIDPRVSPVSGDPDRLQQVVWNLLSNAVKFTPKHGRVQIQVQRVNSHVEIIVSDTGIGIRRDFLPHVFERFRQADAGTTRKTGGLGLGLSIVRHMVELHGGTVGVSSGGEGLGSTFTVRLPSMIVQSEGPRETREHPRTQKTAPLARLANLDGTRVLAIDDEEDALGLLRVVLEAAGADVTIMASPLAALERIAEVNPQVLLVDLGMAEMDGFEFIRRIRASEEAGVRDIPAAALTAFARSEDRTRALESGFEMHLAKPVDPGELVASVATLVRRNIRGR